MTGWRNGLRWLAIVLVVVAFLPVPLLLIGRFVPPLYTPLMFLRLVEGEGLDRDWTSLADMSPNLPSMAIASEDQLFCSHGGFDWKALKAQLSHVRAGRASRGASTISQQTAKNLFLWDGRSWIRKGLEAWYTLQVELLWPKWRIMEVYLNIAELGPGVYGVGAASRYWFDRDAARIDRHQAARLIAILPAPRRWKAEPASAGVRARGRMIESRASLIGDLDDCVTR